MSGATPRLLIEGVTGLSEIVSGDDLGDLIARAADLADGDILVITSKIVSKAEGRFASGERDDLLPAETVQIVARRGPTTIVRNRQGLVMAGAGIDASNTPAGTVLLLPEDPDASARAIRKRIAELAGVRVGVLISDTSGRAWRRGQTDIAIGAAGVRVDEDFAGRRDLFGNELQVTLPALADEIAGAGDLVKGKLRGCPVAVVRGLGHLVLDDDGPGATSMIRGAEEDLFGLGSREAVLRAAHGDALSRPLFGPPTPPAELTAALEPLGVDVVIDENGSLRVRHIADAFTRGRIAGLVEVLCFSAGWAVETHDDLENGTVTMIASPSS